MKIVEENKGPLFITGSWRAGTTLISRIMKNHSEVDVTYDSVHFMRFSYNQYNPISDGKNVRTLILNTKDRLEKRYNLGFSVEDVLDDLSGTITYASVYDAIMTNFLLKKSDKKVWGEKTNLAWSKIPDFLQMFPHGRVIHIIRDPRAVLASWKNFTHAPGNDYLDSIVNCYDSMQKALEYKKLYTNKRYTYVTYEELVKDPHGTTENICKNLDLEFYEMMLDTDGFTDNYGEQWRANSVYQSQLSGISLDVIDKWKSKLEDWEIVLSDIITESVMVRFQYRADDVFKRENYIDTALKEVQKSTLTSEGMVRFLFSGKGFERYPSDPLDETTW